MNTLVIDTKSLSTKAYPKINLHMISLMKDSPIRIASNILISALIKDSTKRDILTNFKINFLFPEFGLDEIYFYKGKIMEKSNLNEKEFDILLLRLLKYVRLIPMYMIIPFREKADELIGRIHKEDTAFIATALAFQCPIWSDDKHFQQQKIVKVLTTKDMIALG